VPLCFCYLVFSWVDIYVCYEFTDWVYVQFCVVLCYIIFKKWQNKIYHYHVLYLNITFEKADRHSMYSGLVYYLLTCQAHSIPTTLLSYTAYDKSNTILYYMLYTFSLTPLFREKQIHKGYEYLNCGDR